MNKIFSRLIICVAAACTTAPAAMAYSAMYVAGSAIDSSWALPSASRQMTRMVGYEKYQWAGWLNAGELKFLHDSADWGNSIVDRNMYINPMQLGVVYVLSEMHGSNDFKYYISEAGWYDIVLDANAMTAVFSRPLYLIGECHTTGGWAANVGARFTPIGNNVFRLTATFDAGNTFCLASCPAAGAGDWNDLGSRRYGASSASRPSIYDGGTYDIIKTSGDNNTYTVANAGTYTITVDMNTMKLSMVSTPVALVGFVDDSNGWDAAAADGLVATGFDNVYVGTTKTSYSGYFLPVTQVGKWDTDVQPTRFNAYGDTRLNAYGNSDVQVPYNETDNTTNHVSTSPTTTRHADYVADKLWSNKARYAPGEEVWIQYSGDRPAGARVRYRHLGEVVYEHELVQEWWSWTPPADDYQGYLVDVYTTDGNGNESIYATIGVDVSSDWCRFPRNGYAAWYDSGRDVVGDVAFLNRRHINVVQFQDCHWRHHRPYCPDDDYTDIFYRPIHKQTIKDYLSTMHGYNMKTLFYDLAYGTTPQDAKAGQDGLDIADGVKTSWYVQDANGNRDYHGLITAGGKSNIDLVNPGNDEWIAYFGGRMKEVFDNLDFDGFQIDQLGGRGNRYDSNGNWINMEEGLGKFIKKMKERFPNKYMVMNSVSDHAQYQITSSGAASACYQELWKYQASFNDMYQCKLRNDSYSGNKLRTIFAAYVNYCYDNSGNFNTPGVLLADACIFSVGGAHLELGTGYNMLTTEYFPNGGRRMTDELVAAITDYYDFNTAYENLLFDYTGELNANLYSTTHKLSQWTKDQAPRAGRIGVHGAKVADGKYVYHLINFTKADFLEWRDIQGTQPEPDELTGIELYIDCDRKVARAWVASPDYLGGVPIDLKFQQVGRTLKLIVPNLKYWTMLVLE